MRRCTRPAGAVQIGRLRPVSRAEGNLGNYPWPPALDSEQAFHPCNEEQVGSQKAIDPFRTTRIYERPDPSEGNINTSVVALGQALKVAQTTGDTASVVRWTTLFGHGYMQFSRPAEALEFYERAARGRNRAGTAVPGDDVRRQRRRAHSREPDRGG